MAAPFANLPPFLNAPGKPPITWHIWHKIFQVHLKAAGGSGWEDERRASALLCALGIEGQRKYFAAQEQLEAEGAVTASGSGTVPKTEAATATTYDTVLQFLDGLFAETTNVLAERHLFTSRKQLPGEMFLDFVTSLKEKALSCKFGATYDDRVRDQVIHGVANAHVRAKLLSYGEALTLQKAEEVGRDLEALNKANAAFGENERLLGSHSGYCGSIQCVAAAQNCGSAASLVPHVTQHGAGFPPGAGGRVQDGSAGSTALAQCCVRCQQVQQLAPKPQVGPYLQHHGKRAFVTFYVTAHGTSLLGLDAVQQLGLLIDGATLTCRPATPVSSQLPAGVPPAFEHLHSGALGRVKDYVHRAKRRQHIVPLSAKLCRLPLALRQQDAIELRRLQDDDGRGRRPHSRLRISNQVFPAQAIRGGPAVQCDSTSAEAQLQLPATQYHPLGLQEESPGYSSSPAVNAPNSNTGEGSNATGSSESAHGSRNPPSSWRDWDRSLKLALDSHHTQSLPGGPGSRRPQRTRKPQPTALARV
ncbi:hypothetical protein HPB52_010488 [Rhipicephalus sanguineus]|uniref:Uncharacterized protein n=1 Tax=Rhipicephalus sanguineus TaxID=34632 RepID=A0A9D4PLQ1_RHISA|nr:hypothetical protein HPB52_010488 [Rhipicephalus sanguineus]